MPSRLTLSIDPQLFPRFPTLRVGGFVALHIDRACSAIGSIHLARLCRRIALRHFVPLGAYDIEALPAPVIRLRTAQPATDWFVPLGARPTDLPLRTGVVVLSAGTTILSWGFNESRQTCLSARTRHAAFVSEAITRAHTSSAIEALDDVRALLAEAGAVMGDLVFVDARNPSAEMRCFHNWSGA
jgi:hypothetical protein